MDGGLKAAGLYVAVTASIGEMVKSLSQAVSAISDAADEIEENMSKAAAALGDFYEGMLSFAGVAAAAVAVAGETSVKAADELELLKKSVMLLGREVGELFLPLVRQMTDGVKTAIATWRGLDAGLKQNLVTMVKYAAIIGVAGLALERTLIFTKSFAEGTVAIIRFARMVLPSVATLTKAMQGVGAAAKAAGWALVYLRQATVGQVFASMAAGMGGATASLKALPAAIAGLGKSFLAILPQVGAVVLPLLAVAAAVAGIVLFAGSLYKSWDDLTFLFRESTAGIVEDMRALGEKAASFFGNLLQGVKDFISSLATAMLDAVFTRVKQVAKFMENVARRLGREELANNLAKVQDLSADAFMGKLKDGAARIGEVISESAGQAGKAISDATKDVREGVSYGLKHSVDGAQQLGTDLAKALHLDELLSLKDKLLGAVPTIGDGSSVELPKDREIEVGRPEKVELPASVRALAQGKDPVMGAYLEMLKANAKAAAEAMKEARDALKSRLVASAGEIAQLAETFRTGMQAGGIWGGIIATLVELLSKSEGFQALVEMLNEIIQIAADTLGGFLVALQPLMGAVGMVVEALFSAITPVLELLGEALQPVAPILVMVADLLSALEPIIAVLVEAIELLLTPLTALGDVAVKGLFIALKYVALGFLYVAKGLATAWNGIVGAIQGVFRALGSIEILGGKPLGFLEDWATSLDGAKLGMDGLNESIARLNDATWESAQARAEEAAAVLRNRQALDKATESITNVPSWWKVAGARFGAADARSPNSAVLPMSSPSLGAALASPAAAPPAGAAQLAPSAPVVETININVQDEFAAGRAFDDMMDRLSQRRTGTRGRPSRYALGD